MFYPVRIQKQRELCAVAQRDTGFRKSMNHVPFLTLQ